MQSASFVCTGGLVRPARRYESITRHQLARDFKLTRSSKTVATPS